MYEPESLLFICHLHLHENFQRSLIRPHSNRTSRRGLEQTNCQPPIQPSNTLRPHNHRNTTKHPSILGDITMHIQKPRRTLHLQPLSHQIQRKHARFRQHARHDPRNSITRPEGEMLGTRQRRPQRLVCREEETHIRHDLPDSRAASAEEPARAFFVCDIADRREQREVDAFASLCGEACAQEIERVCGGCGDAAGNGAGEEGFDGLGGSVGAELG